jgi:uncharacterized membrane protein
MVDKTLVAPPVQARISLRDNWWILIPILALIAAVQSNLFLFLNYVHVFTGVLWTGTDIFMGFILGPILRRVDFPVRRAIISQLMPRMLFYMPTMAAVTTTAGYYLAQRMGFFQLPYPAAYWVAAAWVIVGILTVQGMGVLLPINLRVFFELRKERPDAKLIQRLMGIYIKVVASQALMQLAIIFVMAKFRTGL